MRLKFVLLYYHVYGEEGDYVHIYGGMSKLWVIWDYIVVKYLQRRGGNR